MRDPELLGYTAEAVESALRLIDEQIAVADAMRAALRTALEFLITIEGNEDEAAEVAAEKDEPAVAEEPVRR